MMLCHSSHLPHELQPILGCNCHCQECLQYAHLGGFRNDQLMNDALPRHEAHHESTRLVLAGQLLTNSTMHLLSWQDIALANSLHAIMDVWLDTVQWLH